MRGAFSLPSYDVSLISFLPPACRLPSFSSSFRHPRRNPLGFLFFKRTSIYWISLGLISLRFPPSPRCDNSLVSSFLTTTMSRLGWGGIMPSFFARYQRLPLFSGLLHSKSFPSPRFPLVPTIVPYFLLFSASRGDHFFWTLPSDFFSPSPRVRFNCSIRFFSFPLLPFFPPGDVEDEELPRLLRILPHP